MIANMALAKAVKSLQKAGVDDAATDARILLADAVGIARDRLTLILPDEMTPEMIARFDRHVAARCQRQPVSQIIGRRAFYGRNFIVSPDVLDPRPETELLVQAALAQPFKTVLDLGSGSGCILLSLLAENKMATGQGVDCSKPSLKIASKNAAQLNLMKRCKFSHSNWFEGITARFDLIVSNPPYITAKEMQTLAPETRDWEPEMALTSGGDGLQAYRIITATAAKHLNADGRLIVEIGQAQADAVCALFKGAGFDGITSLQDMDGRDRVILGVMA